MVLGTVDPIEPELIRQVHVVHVARDHCDRALSIEQPVRHWRPPQLLLNGPIRKADKEGGLHQADYCRLRDSTNHCRSICLHNQLQCLPRSRLT